MVFSHSCGKLDVFIRNRFVKFVYIFIMKTTNDLKLKKDQVFISRINGRLKRAIAKAAKTDGVSMTQYIERLVKVDLDQRDLAVTVNEKV